MAQHCWRRLGESGMSYFHTVALPNTVDNNSGNLGLSYFHTVALHAHEYRPVPSAVLPGIPNLEIFESQPGSPTAQSGPTLNILNHPIGSGQSSVRDRRLTRPIAQNAKLVNTSKLRCAHPHAYVSVVNNMLRNMRCCLQYVAQHAVSGAHLKAVWSRTLARAGLYKVAPIYLTRYHARSLLKVKKVKVQSLEARLEVVRSRVHLLAAPRGEILCTREDPEDPLPTSSQEAPREISRSFFLSRDRVSCLSYRLKLLVCRAAPPGHVANRDRGEDFFLKFRLLPVE